MLSANPASKSQLGSSTLVHSTLQVFLHEDSAQLESVKITDFGLAADLMEGCHHFTPTTDGTRYCLLCSCCKAPLVVFWEEVFLCIVEAI